MQTDLWANLLSNRTTDLPALELLIMLLCEPWLCTFLKHAPVLDHLMTCNRSHEILQLLIKENFLSSVRTLLSSKNASVTVRNYRSLPCPDIDVKTLQETCTTPSNFYTGRFDEHAAKYDSYKRIVQCFPLATTDLLRYLTRNANVLYVSYSKYLETHTQSPLVTLLFSSDQMRNIHRSFMNCWQFILRLRLAPAVYRGHAPHPTWCVGKYNENGFLLTTREWLNYSWAIQLMLSNYKAPQRTWQDIDAFSMPVNMNYLYWTGNQTLVSAVMAGIALKLIKIDLETLTTYMGVAGGNSYHLFHTLVHRYAPTNQLLYEIYNSNTKMNRRGSFTHFVLSFVFAGLPHYMHYRDIQLMLAEFNCLAHVDKSKYSALFGFMNKKLIHNINTLRPVSIIPECTEIPHTIDDIEEEPSIDFTANDNNYLELTSDTIIVDSKRMSILNAIWLLCTEPWISDKLSRLVMRTTILGISMSTCRLSRMQKLGPMDDIDIECFQNRSDRYDFPDTTSNGYKTCKTKESFVMFLYALDLMHTASTKNIQMTDMHVVIPRAQQTVVAALVPELYNLVLVEDEVFPGHVLPTYSGNKLSSTDSATIIDMIRTRCHKHNTDADHHCEPTTQLRPHLYTRPSMDWYQLNHGKRKYTDEYDSSIQYARP
jgi:hypothetical protein